MPQKVKHAAEHVAILEKPIGNSKRVNTRQAMNSHGSRARTRLRHHQLVPSQYRGDGPWVRGKRGYGLAVERKGKSILGFPLKLL